MDTRNVDRTTLESVCERAAKYHRMCVADRATPLELEYEVRGYPDRGPIMVQPNGWAKVGIVRDEVELWSLAVWWNPDADRIKLEKPPPPPLITQPSSAPMIGAPMYYPVAGSSVTLDRPIVASPGWIYTYQGVDYDADEAEQLATKLESIKGWTWRRE